MAGPDKRENLIAKKLDYLSFHERMGPKIGMDCNIIDYLETFHPLTFLNLEIFICSFGIAISPFSPYSPIPCVSGVSVWGVFGECGELSPDSPCPQSVDCSWFRECGEFGEFV
jgi:hypothetical protein